MGFQQPAGIPDLWIQNCAFMEPDSKLPDLKSEIMSPTVKLRAIADDFALKAGIGERKREG